MDLTRNDKVVWTAPADAATYEVTLEQVGEVLNDPVVVAFPEIEAVLLVGASPDGSNRSVRVVALDVDGRKSPAALLTNVTVKFAPVAVTGLAIVPIV